MSIESLLKGLASEDSSISFFVFAVPPNHETAEFPSFQLPTSVDGFIDFSNNEVFKVTPQKIFNPSRNCYLYNGLLIVGVSGKTKEVKDWAEYHISLIKSISKFSDWTKDSFTINSEEFIDESPEYLSSDETVDIDDVNALNSVKDLTEREVEQILDEGPTDEERETIDFLRKTVDK